MGETKRFNFGMCWKVYGTQSIEVPADFTYEQAEQYVKDHWNEIPLPSGDYVEDSDEPDFEDSYFDE